MEDMGANHPHEKSPAPAGQITLPNRFIAISFAIAIMATGGLGFQVWSAYQEMQFIHTHTFRLQSLSDRIIHLDEVLTMSARQAAATSSPRWEERYLKHVDLLDSALQEIEQLAGEIYLHRARETTEANTRLVEIEGQAFALVREGDSTRALQLLDSAEYQTHKTHYSHGMEELRKDLEQKNQQDIAASQRAVYIAAIEILVALPLMIFVWMRISALLKRYQSAREEVERALITAREISEETARAKSNFLANMSHEIRTPMNAIIGMSHIALQTDLDHKQRDYINKINGAAESLLRMINDILDFSKLETDKLDIEETPFRLSEVLDNLAILTTLGTREKGLAFQIDLQPDVPDELVGDSTRLAQVLQNLTDNAVKFTDEGEIVIHIEKLGAIDNRVTLQFTVRDTGIGMVEEQMDKLFQSFSQVDGSSTRKYGGIGLGLILSKKLIELLGGEIRVESSYGKGSSFIFTANFTLSSAAEPVTQPRTEARNTLQAPLQTNGEREGLTAKEELPAIDLSSDLRQLAERIDNFDSTAVESVSELMESIQDAGLRTSLGQLRDYLGEYDFDSAATLLAEILRQQDG
ncbi:MAG: ATP-binding protein [Sedimenticola sp.]